MTPQSVISRLRAIWLRWIHRTTTIHYSAFIHYTAQLSCKHWNHIVIGRSARLDEHVWLNVPSEASQKNIPIIRIGHGACIGRNSVISGKNHIDIGDMCLTGPQVLIMDHAHEYRDVNRPIISQGTTPGGQIVVETGCWIGFGAVLLANRGMLRIGRNAVIGANAIVTHDVLPYTVVVGAPAYPICRYDFQQNRWVPLGQKKS